jgi:hypothetical protein
MSGRKLTDAYWMEVGAVRERERIIALLKTELPRVTGCGCCLDADLSSEELIALIKGNNK